MLFGDEIMEITYVKEHMTATLLHSIPPPEPHLGCLNVAQKALERATPKREEAHHGSHRGQEYGQTHSG